jgi:hypothetical protein
VWSVCGQSRPSQAGFGHSFEPPESKLPSHLGPVEAVSLVITSEVLAPTGSAHRRLGHWRTNWRMGAKIPANVNIHNGLENRRNLSADRSKLGTGIGTGFSGPHRT